MSLKVKLNRLLHWQWCSRSNMLDNWRGVRIEADEDDGGGIAEF